jgi:hypothetical protein
MIQPARPVGQSTLAYVAAAAAAVGLLCLATTC